MTKKNILLVTADQWRGDCISALGHPDVKTPNLDALIADGVTFENHYSVCAPCGPARTSLLTGMYLQNHRVVGNGTPLDNRFTNIAREISKLGYMPKLFGYTDTSLDPNHYSDAEVRKNGYEGILPGFDEGVFLPAENPEHWLNWLKTKGYDFDSVDEAFEPIEAYSQTGDEGRAVKPVPHKAEHSQAAFLTEKVIDYITQTEEKWFVHLSYLRPHPPFNAPEPYNKLYDPKSIVGPIYKDDQNDEHPWLEQARGALGSWPEIWMQDLYASKDFKKEALQIRATYYGLISKIDHYFGTLIDHLKKTEEYENTLIVFTSDHGELMGDHGLFGKRGYFKESYHVPLIIYDSELCNKMEKRRINTFTESVDIMPTILDCLDIDIPRQCDGSSLIPFLNNHKVPTNWRNFAHWEYDFRDVRDLSLETNLDIEMDDCQLNVISNNEYRYVHFTNLAPMFFDLRNDPIGQLNVIDNPKYTTKVLEFAQQLLSWRMHNDERLLTGYSVSREDIYHR